MKLCRWVLDIRTRYSSTPIRFYKLGLRYIYIVVSESTLDSELDYSLLTLLADAMASLVIFPGEGRSK